MNQIDKLLNRFRIQWKRSGVELGSSTSDKQYGLVPVDSSFGIVHVAPEDMDILKLTIPVSKRSKYEK